MMWNGTVKDWTTGTHLRDAINRAGLDGDKLIAMAKDPKNDKKYQKLINANQKLQDAANHGGVPLFVVRGEPFFGQDRIDQLLWRMFKASLCRSKVKYHAMCLSHDPIKRVVC